MATVENQRDGDGQLPGPESAARAPQPAVALARIAECNRTRADELDLGGLGLTEIPYEVAGLPWLKALYLGGEPMPEKGLITGTASKTKTSATRCVDCPRALYPHYRC